MTITYSIWQGSRLLSINNVATDTKEIDHLIKSINESDLDNSHNFYSNVQEIKVGK